MPKKFFIITYGCQMNKSDSERIAALLQRQGHSPAPGPEQADLVVVNICSVRQKAIDKVINKINVLRHNKPQKIVLTGCILDADKEKFEKLGVDIKQFKDLEKVKPKTGFVPIMQGCNNFCAYCVVPYTRGRERYRPPEEIICEIKHLIKRGIKEITLLGQNVNSWKFPSRHSERSEESHIRTQTRRDSSAAGLRMTTICHSERSEESHNTTTGSFAPLRGACAEAGSAGRSAQNDNIADFADLLREINNLPGDFKIRFLTNHPKDMTDKLIETIARCRKIEKYIHLPVQSGDNDILRKMNRGYTREQYLNLVKKIRDKIPDVELTTDVIVGFPGETQQAFENTVDLFKRVKFSNAFIAKYSPRPGTVASHLEDDVTPAVKAEREAVLRAALRAQRVCKADEFFGPKAN